MQMISRGRNTYVTLILIEFHFVVVFLRGLADNALKIIALLRFGLIIHGLDQLIPEPILNFNQIYRPEIGNSCTTGSPLCHVLILGVRENLCLRPVILLLSSKISFGNRLLP